MQFPALDPKHAAVGAYFVFMGLNILGVKLAATFELVVCVLAVAELLVFMGVVAPAFSFSNFALNGWAGSDTFGAPAIAGMFAAIPFAIWFFFFVRLQFDHVKQLLLTAYLLQIGDQRRLTKQVESTVAISPRQADTSTDRRHRQASTSDQTGCRRACACCQANPGASRQAG